MRVDLPGLSIAVEDDGTGLPVILLHGFPLSGEMWVSVRPALTQVARVITPDLRGFGDSDAPSDGYTMDGLATDVLALADELGLERFVVAGHSMGGYVALRIAARAADRLAGLILVDSRAGADDAAARQRRDDAIAALERNGKGDFLDSFVPNLVAPDMRARAPRFVAELRAIAGGVPAGVLAACLAGMRDRPDGWAVLGALAAPFLALAGSEDVIASPGEAEAMARAARAGTAVVIPGAGHTPPVERPIPTAEAMVAFLAGITGPAPLGSGSGKGS